jgi:hypothetical protein
MVTGNQNRAETRKGFIPQMIIKHRYSEISIINSLKKVTVLVILRAVM